MIEFERANASLNDDHWEARSADLINTLMRSTISLINEAQAHTSITVYRGTSDPHTIRKNMFFSDSEDFASNHGEVHTYQLNFSSDQVFDSLNGEQVSSLLPLYEPFDGQEINTLEQYMEYSSDTWEMLEAEWGISDGRTCPYPVAIIYEGGERNYLVGDPRGIVVFIK